VYLHPRRLETSPRWVTSESWWECMVGCLTTWLMTTGFLPLNPGYKVDKMGLKKHQKRRWVIKRLCQAMSQHLGLQCCTSWCSFFWGKQCSGLPNQFLSGCRSNVTFVEKMVSLIIFSGPALKWWFMAQHWSPKLEGKKKPFWPLFSSPYRRGHKKMYVYIYIIIYVYIHMYEIPRISTDYLPVLDSSTYPHFDVHSIIQCLRGSYHHISSTFGFWWLCIPFWR
jgi:hypothetical protein